MHSTIISPYPTQSSMLSNALKRNNMQCLILSPENLFNGWTPHTDVVIFYHPLQYKVWKRLQGFLKSYSNKIPIILIGKIHLTVFNEIEFREFLPRTVLIEDKIKLEDMPSIIKECAGQRLNENKVRYLQINSMVLDRKNRIIIQGLDSAKLTKKEYFLLELLMLNAGEVTSRDSIIDYVWDRRNFISQNTIDVYISKLRKKIDNKSKTSLISTFPCLGYQFNKR